MGLTMEFTDTLVVVTCWCGINHAIPDNLRSYQERCHRDGREPHYVYCPLGHTHAPAGKGEAEKLRERLADERARSGRLAARADQAEARRRAQKAATTKARKRHAAGVCPCCNRSFKQLRRHMASQHPDYDPAAE